MKNLHLAYVENDPVIAIHRNGYQGLVVGMVRFYDADPQTVGWADDGWFDPMPTRPCIHFTTGEIILGRVEVTCGPVTFIPLDHGDERIARWYSVTNGLNQIDLEAHRDNAETAIREEMAIRLAIQAKNT